ncbi:MAG TPA: c-type cytochrome [Terriglobales bacterium]|jgi:photosynthetic reaction center cytochrome c subunit|nr:c-type cytochrome [Terriglobales bacterium]
MKQSTGSIRVSAVQAVAAVVILLALGTGAPAQAQNAPSSAEPKTTEQAFKNIKVLKGLPADQLIPSMQFISASLGVECEFCHVERAFEKDDKKPKEAARKMIQMMFAINQDDFESHREVTCNTCHRGSPHPVSIPVIASEDQAPEAAAMERGEQGGSPDQSTDASQPVDPILEKYLAAVGGANAVQKVSSRVEKGNATMGGRQIPIEIYAQAPDKRVSILHLPGGDNITAFDGHGGWLGNPGRPSRPMGPSEIDAARLDADLYFPVHVKEIFSELHVASSEKIGGQDLTVVRALRQGKPPVKLYFDKSGLLVRMVRYGDSALGLNPTQVDYADYRDAGGVKIPYQWTIARPSGRFTIRVDKVEQNVPIDAARFAPPPPPPGQNPPAP